MPYFLLFLMVIFALPAEARLKEFDHVYDVNLQEDIPNLQELQKEYKEKDSDYDWKYDFSWEMPKDFNSDFKSKIMNFGKSDKRIANADEEDLYRAIKRLPKWTYPYIGPSLHNIPGLSGKILDMPGIKETKNKFPDKIASQLKDIPNIKDVSPDLYIFLMPQMLGEGYESIEFPDLADDMDDNYDPNIKIKESFLQKIRAKVPVENFGIDAKPKTTIKYRNINVGPNTPLTSSDVQAFADTIPEIKKFFQNNRNDMRLIVTDSLINYWDEKNGVNPNAAFLKGIVNPCQTLVRRVKWSNLGLEFQQAVGKQGFGIDDWAYTCDKTIKAYRVATISNGVLSALKLWNKSYFYSLSNDNLLSNEEKKRYKYFIEADIRMFDTTREDINAVLPNAKKLTPILLDMESYFGGTIIILM